MSFVAGWTLITIAVLLAADVAAAVLFGRRYLRWGAALLPPEYRNLFEGFINLPTNVLALVGLAELTIAVILYRLGLGLIR